MFVSFLHSGIADGTCRRNGLARRKGEGKKLHQVLGNKWLLCSAAARVQSKPCSRVVERNEEMKCHAKMTTGPTDQRVNKC